MARARVYLEDGLEISYPPVETLSDEYLSARSLSREAYAAMRAERVVREAQAPAPGQLAPDFEVERLAADGSRTGETFRLSDQRGRPVALMFGSYT